MTDDPAMSKLKDEIRSRLERVCSHLPNDSFEQLIQKIAEKERKTSTRPSWSEPAGTSSRSLGAG